MVSVIITTYGGGEKLERAISSVLCQTYKDLEIIVVDDNDPYTDSRDKTERIMEKFKHNEKVKYIKHKKNMNGSAARNTGINEAQGEYIAFLDDDDIYLPKRIELSLKFLNKNTQYKGVCTGVIFIENGYIYDSLIPTQNELHYQNIILNQSVIGTGSNIFIQSDVIRHISGFDESFFRFQDLEFMIRITQVCRIGYCNDLLIIKDVNQNRKLNYLKIKNALNHFNMVFSKEIAKLTMDEATQYWTDRAKMLLYIAKTWGTKVDVKDAENFINEKQILIPKYWIVKNKILKIIKDILKDSGYDILRQIKYKNKDKIYRKHLSKEIVHDIGIWNLR